MKRRIYLNFLYLILSSVLLLSVLLSLFFYNSFKSREMTSVKDSAGLIADFLNSGVDGQLSDYVSGGGLRITVITPDGTVLLDNQTVADSLDNHADRTEIAGALQNGTGEATRYSHTFSLENYYYAVRLNNGNILRLSKSIDSIAGVFTASLPVVLIVTALVMLAADFLALRLTDNIVRPLDGIDFDNFAEKNTAIYDELSPFMKKIDEQKREIARQLIALKNRADTIEAITENMREGLILLDQNGMVLTANKAVSEIFGEVGGMAHENILHVCRDVDFQQGVKQCLRRDAAEISFERGGKMYTVYFSPVPGDLGEGGSSGGAVIFFFDVTEWHRAEQQRREFSANVSHELKTPLTSISALSEMIESGMAKNDDIKGFAAKISEQAGRLVYIIDDIIKLAEFDEGKAGGAYKSEAYKKRDIFDLYELAESVVNALRGNSKGVVINLAGERFDISANRRMIDELLYNLIDNGIKYNKDGGCVTVSLSRENGLCKISVSDTGIGIPKEHQSRLFERFYRVDKSRSKKTGGTGLGLSIVKHIAEHHGGRLELESTEGVGTTIVCWFAL